MNLTVTLSQTEISVPPGEQVLLEVTVRNTSTIVDLFTFEVLGDAGRWASVVPEELRLNPDTEGSVFVRFDVPREADVGSGQVPFAVKVASQGDATGTVVEEGLLIVGRFADLSAELVPRTARGTRGTHHEVAFDNRGNTRLNLDLEARDADGVLSFRIDPPTLVVEPNAAAFARIKVRAGRRFLRGTPRTHPFQVTATGTDGTAQPLDGVMLQQPLLPPWTAKALVAAVAGALVLALLWAAVLKPQVRSVAQDAVADPLARTNEAVNKVGAAVGQNPNLPTQGEGVVKAEPASTPTTAAAGAASLIATTFGSPFDHRLAVDGTGTVEDSFAVDAHKLFSLTDVVLENPGGDSGTITLLRGSEILFRQTLANFRSADYHFVAPILFDEGTRIVLRVDCRNAGPNCTAASQLSGFLKSKSAS